MQISLAIPTVLANVLFAASFALANPATLPDHPGYPMGKAIDPVRRPVRPVEPRRSCSSRCSSMVGGEPRQQQPVFAPGMPEPVAVYVDTYGTGQVDEGRLGGLLREMVRLFYPDGANPKPFPALLPFCFGLAADTVRYLKPLLGGP